ncbi:MAG: type II toxin-antitoxin system VapC family toxin [bacterium]|nr:type II toxin-antitoxin system VapC family toxin [bacterium]
MKYLVDTDWIIRFLRGQKQTVEALNRLYDEGFAISIISFSEVYEGIYRFDGGKRKELEENFQNFLTGIQILNIDENVARIFAEQRAKLRKENKLIDNFDLLIGSTALYYNLELLTDNVKHFERIENLKFRNLNDISIVPQPGSITTG